MTKPKYGRTDANHAEIIGWFLELGCTVKDTSQLGDDFPDLIIGLIGLDQQVEVKTEDGKLSAGQINHNAKWRGRAPVVVRTQQDCIDLVQRIRKGK